MLLLLEYTLDVAKCKSIIAWEKQNISEICRRYDASGNGRGMADEFFQLGEEATDLHVKWGKFDLEAAQINGGDDRASFLRGKPSDILYWWHVLDTLDVLQATCVMFNKEVGASSMERPTSIRDLAAQRKARAKSARDDAMSIMTEAQTETNEQLSRMGDSMSHMGESMSNMAYARLNENIMDLRSKRRELRRALKEEDDSDEAADIKAEIASIDQQIEGVSKRFKSA